jgi:plasmid stabilization system protein ParE
LAISDLVGIRDCIAGEANEAVAVSFIKRIQNRIESLGSFPNRGEAFPVIRPGARKLSFERSYLILYRVEGSLVLVDRVVSARRDLDALE